MNTFEKEIKKRLESNKDNLKLKEAASRFTQESTEPKYSYNFSALGKVDPFVKTKGVGF